MNSLRSRLILSHAVVAVVALLAGALVLVVLLRGYQAQLAQSRLEDLAVPLALQLRERAQSGESPSELVEFLRDQARELGIRVLIVNARGRVLADTASGDELTGRLLALPERRPVSNPEGGQSATGRQSHGFSFSGRDGQRYHAVFVASRLALPSGAERPAVAGLVLAVPDERLPSPLGQLGRRLVIAAIVSLLAAGLLSLALARWIHRPLTRLLEAANALARGEYSQRALPEGPREVAALAVGFNQMAAEVERNQRVLRDFVANVSHELRTPLTAIRGFIQGLRDGVLADEAERERALGIMDRETRRLQGMVAELLELSRLEARQVTFQRVPVDLADLIAHCLEVFAPRAAEQKVSLTHEVPADLRVQGDADRLEQVLTNLLDNALTHTPSDGSVTVKAARRNGSVVVEVADSGPGIPAEELPRVFERFYRGNGSGGAGLGLAIAREVARGHGGELDVASAPGEGTRFVMRLPDVPNAPRAKGSGVPGD